MEAGRSLATIVPIEAVIIENRYRKDLGDLKALAASIEEVGLLQSPVIRTDNRLVAGHRRVEACKLLGWTEIPVRVVDIEHIIYAEYAENAIRKDFAPSEMVAITDSIRELEASKAKERQLNALKNVGESIVGATCPNDDEDKGRTNDHLAKLVGTSRRSLEKAAAIVRAGEEDVDYQDLVDLMDTTGKIDGAYQQLRQRQKQTEAAEESDPGPVPSANIEVVQAEPLEWMTQHKAEFDCLITDLPCNSTGKADVFSSPVEFRLFTRQWVKLAFECLRQEYHAFIFCPSQHIADLEAVLRELGKPICSRIIWHHPDTVKCKQSGAALETSYHAIIHCGRSDLNRDAGMLSDVQTYDHPKSECTDDIFRRKEKPLELIAWLVEIGSKRGAKVLDCFAYSGYTGVVCRELGRQCVMVEKSAACAKTIKFRLLNNHEVRATRRYVYVPKRIDNLPTYESLRDSEND